MFGIVILSPLSCSFYMYIFHLIQQASKHLFEISNPFISVSLHMLQYHF